MRPENKHTLEKCIDVLKKLHFNPDNIMVTGSIALDMLGVLPLDRISHDFDCIIKCDDQTWRCLKLIEAICNSDTNDEKKDYPDRKNMITLTADDTVMNIWKYDSCFDWSNVKDSITGVRIATVRHTLNAKKSFGRVKDFKDIYDIIRDILHV